MDLDRFRVFEALKHLLPEIRIGIKSRDLVFVLVCHDLVEHVGHRLRQPQGSGPMLFLSAFDGQNDVPIYGGIGGILVKREFAFVKRNLFVNIKRPGCFFRRER